MFSRAAAPAWAAAVALALLPAVAAQTRHGEVGHNVKHINVDQEAANIEVEREIAEAKNMSSIMQLVCNNKRTGQEGDRTPAPPMWVMEQQNPDAGKCDKPLFVGSTHLFEIEQQKCGGYPGVPRRLAPAVERLVDPSSFYDYGSFSAHTGYESVGRSLIYLYRDLFNPDKLSLFMIHGKDKNKPCQILCSKELYRKQNETGEDVEQGKHCGHCGEDRAQCMSREAVEKHVPNHTKYHWKQPFEDKQLMSNGDRSWQELATVWMSIGGVPDGTHIVLADDGTKEFGWTNDLDFSSALPTHWDSEWNAEMNDGKGGYINCGAPSMSCPHSPPKGESAAHHLAGRWQFYHNTDGGAIDGLPLDEEWELKIDIKFGTPRGWKEQRNNISWNDGSMFPIDNPTPWTVPLVNEIEGMNGAASPPHGTKLPLKNETMNDWRYYLGDGQFEQLSECAPFYIRNKIYQNQSDAPAEENPDITNHTCTHVLEGDVVTFCSVAINEKGGQIRFDFDWGDGATTEAMVGMSGALVCADHVYGGCASRAVYDINVTATNQQGCSDTKQYWACCTTAAPTKDPTSAPTAPTVSPTTVSPTVKPCDDPDKPCTYGDPFVTFRGKSTQFYLAAGEETALLRCGSGAAEWELLGTAFGTGVPGDTQQWFRSFAVRAQGSVLRVEALQDAGVAERPAAAAAAANATGGDAIRAIEVKVREALRQLRGAAGDGAGRSAAPATLRARLDAGSEADVTPFNHTVTQDRSKPLGAGFVEVVTVTGPDFGLQFKSSPVQKGGAQNIHLDLQITKLNVDGCRGILPELWGVAPLSEAVSKMLLPPGA